MSFSCLAILLPAKMFVLPWDQIHRSCHGRTFIGIWRFSWLRWRDRPDDYASVFFRRIKPKVQNPHLLIFREGSHWLLMVTRLAFVQFFYLLFVRWLFSTCFIIFIISLINAGKSIGQREVTRLPSTTTSLSSQMPPDRKKTRIACEGGSSLNF